MHKQSGFTLVEVLLALLLTAVLAVTSFFVMQGLLGLYVLYQNDIEKLHNTLSLQNFLYTNIGKAGSGLFSFPNNAVEWDGTKLTVSYMPTVLGIRDCLNNNVDVNTLVKESWFVEQHSEFGWGLSCTRGGQKDMLWLGVQRMEVLFWLDRYTAAGNILGHDGVADTFVTQISSSDGIVALEIVVWFAAYSTRVLIPLR